jgi:hypothetical protein
MVIVLMKFITARALPGAARCKSSGEFARDEPERRLARRLQ